jgi:hypothetical protein
MSDGGTTMFVTSTGASPSPELALLRVDAGAAVHYVVPFPAAQGVPSGSLAWQYSSASGDLLLLWDTPTQRLISCPGLDVFDPTASSSLDGRRFLFGIQSLPSSPVIGGPLVLVSPDGDGRDGTCTQLAAGDAHDHQFSPAGALAWLVDVSEGSALWTAAGDGSAAREIGRGPIQTAPWSPYFFAASELEMRIARDLVWIDVNDAPVKMHYIAQDVFIRPLDYDRQVLIGYDWSDQDGTGTLGLVDRDTGAKRLISSQVVTYDAARPASADSPVQNYIVYLVRGRNPSSQDGLWIATITKDDIR